MLGVGDDAAVVNVPSGFELAISVDSMSEGTHFFPGLEPELIAHKLMAVNLSDMAAMGALPKWAVITSCTPQLDEDWVDRFTGELNAMAEKYGVQIIGGDTTKGPMVFSLTIMGLLPRAQRLTRSKAQIGDSLYCSGTIGDAALALAKLYGHVELKESLFLQVLPALNRPIPQINLGQQLLGLASACLDMSDGLVGDCGQICKSSAVSIEVDVEKLPLSLAYREYLMNGGSIEYATSGGDDYQLLFTASSDKHEYMSTIAQELGVTISRIGRVIEKGDTDVVLLHNGQVSDLNLRAYEHFHES